MAQSHLDVQALYVTLDSERQQRGLSWRQVAQEAGIGPSTLSRMAQGNRPDVDSFAALVHWLGLPAEQFMRHPESAAEPHQAMSPAQVVASLMRADKNLDPDSAAAIDDILQAAMRLAQKRANDLREAVIVRRGFASAADRLAVAVRVKLKIDVHDRLDPRVLAAERGIPVVSINDLVNEGADPSSIHQLTVVDRRAFSAGTILVGSTRLIIFNPAHSDGRLANSLTHELAHLLLEHAPGPAIGPGGCRVWDREMEDEADLLAAILLVPRDAALACARVGLPHAIGAARFGVSADLMQWRTDHTGATRQAQAAARQRGRTIPRLSKADLAELPTCCDLAWLSDLTVKEWRSLLAACGRSLSTGSVADLVACLQQPAAYR